jgi:cytochrome c553
LRADEGAEDPRNIIPLCDPCHKAQHRGTLELLPLMAKREQAYVVSLVGIEEARRRTTNQRSAA